MKEKGQGLVETALVLPFLLVLIVGIIEMGVILNRQITVINAAREGARFGAYGAEADSIYSQTLLATSQMFEFTEENAVVAVVHAETNNAGTAFNKWIENVYPDGEDVPHVTKKEILADLRVGCATEPNPPCAVAANLKIVIVDVRYRHESISGLPIMGDLFGLVPIGSWTVMRVH